MLYVVYVIKAIIKSFEHYLSLLIWTVFDTLLILEKNTYIQKSNKYNLSDNKKKNFDFFLLNLSNFNWNKAQSYSNIFWYSYYIGLYVKNYIGIFIKWAFINLSFKQKARELLMMWRKTYTPEFLKQYYTSSWYYFYTLTQLFYTRSVHELLDLVSKDMTNANIKQHKRLFYEFGSLIKIYYELLSDIHQLKGFKLYFKGKLGRKGSVKKSIIRISAGEISNTKKTLKFNHKNFLVYTETGVVGCYLSLFY